MTISLSDDLLQTQVFGYIKDANNNPIAGVKVTFKCNSTMLDDNSFAIDLEAYTDANGLYEQTMGRTEATGQIIEVYGEWIDPLSGKKKWFKEFIVTGTTTPISVQAARATIAGEQTITGGAQGPTGPAGPTGPTGPSGAGGEANTVSSVGAGLSLFKQKTGVDFEFNAIKSENSRITLALDGVSNDIEITLVESAIDHDALTNYVANKHIDWTAATDDFATTGLMTGTELDLVHTAAAPDEHALEICVVAGGFGDVKALDIDYQVGAMAAGDSEGIILVNIDESAATGGDIHALEVLATEGSATVWMSLSGIGVGPIEQSAGTFGAPSSALVNAVSSLTEFASAGTNVQIFVNDNDTVTLGSAAKFEEIEVLLAIVASGSGVAPTFEYSTGSGTWAFFTPVDGTNAFKNSGVIAWLDTDIPSWAVGAGTEFLIRITRTKNSLSTVPTESTIQIGTSVVYSWDKDGDVSINNLETAGPISAGPNASILTTTAIHAPGGSGTGIGLSTTGMSIMHGGSMYIYTAGSGMVLDKPLKSSNATAAAPLFSFVGQTNGGMYRNPALNAVEISCEGAEAIRCVDGGGLVTTCPAAVIADGQHYANSLSFSVDESGHNLLVKVLYADGTTFKTASISLT